MSGVSIIRKSHVWGDLPKITVRTPDDINPRYYEYTGDEEASERQRKELAQRIGSLSPTRELILDTLAARWRLGENLWTFDSRLKPQLDWLAEQGLVWTMHGIVEKTLRAGLTDAGLLYSAMSGKPRVW